MFAWPALAAAAPPPPSQTEEISGLRVLPEALAPGSAPQTAAENGALVSALSAYAANRTSLTPLEAFASAHPASPWRAALETNLGLLYFHQGYLSKALAAWAEAWRVGKNETSPQLAPIVDGAVAQLAWLDSRLGREDELTELLASIGSRHVRGAAVQALSQARTGLAAMRSRPSEIFRCGPIALDRLAAAQHGDKPTFAAMGAFRKSPYAQTGPKGVSLKELADLSAQVGMNYQVVKRQAGSPFAVPSIVHWKVGHYGLLLREQNGRYLLRDTVNLDKDIWVTGAALEAETSGYFLTPSGPLPPGYSAVSDEEAGAVRGKGDTPNKQPGCTTGHDQTKPKATCPKTGLASWTVHMMLVSLNIQDTPVGYVPPVGPEVKFHVNYDALEADQPQTLSYSNLGFLWNFDSAEKPPRRLRNT